MYNTHRLIDSERFGKTLQECQADRGGVCCLPLSHVQYSPIDWQREVWQNSPGMPGRQGGGGVCCLSLTSHIQYSRTDWQPEVWQSFPRMGHMGLAVLWQLAAVNDKEFLTYAMYSWWQIFIYILIILKFHVYCCFWLDEKICTFSGLKLPQKRREKSLFPPAELGRSEILAERSEFLAVTETCGDLSNQLSLYHVYLSLHFTYHPI